MNLFGRNGILNPSPVVWVTTKDDRAIRGVLVERNGAGMVLRAAQLGTEEGAGTGRAERWQRLDGDVVIPADNVSFYSTGLDPAILE